MQIRVRRTPVFEPGTFLCPVRAKESQLLVKESVFFLPLLTSASNMLILMKVLCFTKYFLGLDASAVQQDASMAGAT